MTKDKLLENDLMIRDVNSLKKLAALWGIKKLGADKKSICKTMALSFVQPFYLKTILEKLTPTQVKILAIIINSKSVQTLGEIAKKMLMAPINVEKELQTLKNFSLVYQRKNRERLTSNLDKYYSYTEIKPKVKAEPNLKGEKYKVLLEKTIAKLDLQDISPDFLKIVEARKNLKGPLLGKFIVEPDNLQKVLTSLSVLERELILEIFYNGGVININKVRNIVSLRKGDFEQTVKHLMSIYLLFDVYFVEEKFVRVLVMPREFFKFLQKNPLTLPPPKDAKPRSESTAFNEFDFILNMKKLAAFVQRKGLSLAKSGKIKHSDLKRTEAALIPMDMSIYPEKGELYFAELILPILRILELVNLKYDNLVLSDSITKFLKRNPLDLMQTILQEISESRDKRGVYEEIFESREMPFFKKEIFNNCVEFITENPGIQHNVILAILIREKILFAPGFKMKNFDSEFRETRREVISALFYLHTFGLIKVNYPKRELNLSEIGLNYFRGDELKDENEKGGIILNPDLSIIALPDKLSLHGIHLLKVYTELKEFDNVYHFQLTKESFQEGIMLGYDSQVFRDFLRNTSRQDLPQNLVFLLDEWGKSLPIIDIEDDCVLVKMSDEQQAELLLGQLRGKKIVKEELSSTAIIIDNDRIFELIQFAEKLNMIVKLKR